MNVISIFLLIWGLVCILVPIYTALVYPVMKLRTPDAINMIEDQFVDVASLSDKESKNYKFVKGWILGNDKSLIKSAKVRQYGVILIGFSSAVICFVGAYYFRT